MATAEATLTEFLRDPNAVVDRLEQTDVVLHRLNADDLRLSLESRSEAVATSVGFLGRVFRAALADDVVRKRLRLAAAGIPWLSFLPEQEREEFLDEFFRVAEASAELGVMAPLGQLLREWQATAAIYADPALASELRRPLPGDGGDVPAPSPKEVIGKTRSARCAATRTRRMGSTVRGARGGRGLGSAVRRGAGPGARGLDGASNGPAPAEGAPASVEGGSGDAIHRRPPA